MSTAVVSPLTMKKASSSHAIVVLLCICFLAMPLPTSALKLQHLPTKRISSIRCRKTHRWSIGAELNKNEQQLPRAAVSAIVQCRIDQQLYYLLVQRGNHPNKGLWSLPGGKLEWGESTLGGAQRELFEETIWPDHQTTRDQLQWYPHAVAVTESIGEGYHYLIAQCFAKLTGCSSLPRLEAADDAAQCDWFLPSEMHQLPMTPGVFPLIRRVEELSEKGLLL